LANLGTRCNGHSTVVECPLCHLFYQSRLQSKTSSSIYELRVYSYLKTSKAITFGLCRKENRAKDIPCLGVVPSGMKGDTFRLQADKAGRLFCLEEDRHDALLFTPRILGPNADFSQVKEWLNFCASHHSPCQNRETQVAGLKLIDCETYDVVPAPENTTYVALSYVWGTAASNHEKPLTEHGGVQILDPRITKIIRDAVVATRALRYNYLWVDKLCIYPIRSRFSCRRFWRHLPPETAVFIATFLSEPVNPCS
jgi:hypothetical protein